MTPSCRSLATAGIVALATTVATSMPTGCNRDALEGPQLDAAGALDGAPHDVAAASCDGSSVVDAFIPCGDAACAAGEICIRGQCGGCCEVPPRCIAIPLGCCGAPACGCFIRDPCNCTTCSSVESDGIHCVNCQCQCAAPWTPIETPGGRRAIADLRVGDLVYSIDGGRIAVVPIASTHRTPVAHHAVVRVVLASGETLEISAGHPAADGRALGTLAPGDHLGEAEVVSLAMVPYGEPFTYDILPSSDTGSYLAAGAWIGSTLR